MKLLITGASGFLGQYVVDAALQKGYSVRGVVRPHKDLSALPWARHESAEVAEADLTDVNSLDSIMNGVDVVIHLAASKSSDFDECYRGTVVTTQNLIRAMEQAQVQRLIAISSFSVYDYSNPLAGNLLDESCSIENHPDARDAYAQAKLLQEQVIHQFGEQSGAQITVIRPGMIYGKDALWNACHGISLGPFWLIVGGDELMPLTYVENCADAIVASVSSSKSVGEILNIVDDNVPTRKNYTQSIQEYTEEPPYVISVNFQLLQTLAQFSWWVNQHLFFGKIRLPGILVPARLNARFARLSYSNEKAKRCLQWTPRYSTTEALKRCNNNSLSLTIA